MLLRLLRPGGQLLKPGISRPPKGRTRFRRKSFDPVVRFETDPGIKTQVDWTDCGAWLVRTELRTLHAFVGVLGYSRMRLLLATLCDLGGAPVEVLSDRDPALVIGETPAHRPVLAPEWSDLWARRYLSTRRGGTLSIS